jgi:hypothetical protein
LLFCVLNKVMNAHRQQSLVLSSLFYTLSFVAVNLLLWTASLNKSYVCA